MKDSAIFLFPWKLILRVTWGQTSICGHVPKRHSKSFGDLQSKQPNQISLTVTGHTAANWHSQQVSWWLVNCHTPLMFIYTQYYVYLAPEYYYFIFSTVLLANSFLSTVPAYPLAKVWNQDRLLSGWSKGIKSINQKCTYHPGVGIIMKFKREMGRERDRESVSEGKKVSLSFLNSVE